MTDLEAVRACALYGHLEIQSRMRLDGDRLIGEGRTLDYDGNGVLRKDSGWQPTGVTVTGDPAELYLCVAALQRAKGE